MTAGQHRWYNAPSGSANAALTWVQAMTLDASGNLGIGTTAPAEKLEVKGSTTGVLRLSSTSFSYNLFTNNADGSFYLRDVTNSANRLIISSTGAATFSSSVTATSFGGSAYPYNSILGSGADASTGTIFAGSTSGYASSIDVAGGGATNPNTIIFKTASIERVRIASNGNVGINTNDPLARLDIASAYNSSNKLLYVRNSNGSINTNAYDTVVFQQDDVTTLRIVERNISGTDQLMTFSIGDGYGRIAVSDQPLQFFVNGSPTGVGYQGLGGTMAMHIAINGNVLINTTTDAGYKLDVNGTARVQGLATFSGSISSNRAAQGNINGINYFTAGTANWYVGSSAIGSNTDMQFYNHSAGVVVFNIANTTGAATFSSSVTATNFIVPGGTSAQFLKADGSLDSNVYLTSTSSTFSYTSSVTLSPTWQNTGVSSANLGTGAYLITCNANDFAVGGGQYDCTYTGLMYFFAGTTNGVNANEIVLHHSGHADQGRYIYLRTLGTLVADGKTYLQISGNGTNSGASNYQFTFKKLL